MQPEQNTKELYSELSILCEYAIEKALEFKENDKLIRIPHEYLPAKEVNFQTESFDYDWESTKYFDYFEWPVETFSALLNDDLMQSTQSFSVMQQLIDLKVNEAFAKGSIFSLLRDIIKEAVNTQLDVNYYVSTFLTDIDCLLNKKPFVWNVHLWLQNVHLESDQIKLTEGVFLRRPIKDQLGITSIKTTYVKEFDKMMSRKLPATAILSFSVSCSKKDAGELYPSELLYEIEVWLNIFRLFKPSSISIYYQSIFPNSILEYGFSENKNQPFDKFWEGKVDYKDVSTHRLYLKKSEEAILQEFIVKVKPTISQTSPKTYLSGNHFDLALHRYNDSLLKSEVNAYKILSSMTSIEALLSNENTEISFKCRLRVSKLVSFFGFNPIDAFEKMKKAYDLRSRLVHGSKTSEKMNSLLEFARNYAHEIINFNRICILIFLQLKNIKEKDDLIKLIDQSFISDASNESLRELITENVVIPIPNPYFQITIKPEEQNQ